jgi:hypothetical protein
VVEQLQQQSDPRAQASALFALFEASVQAHHRQSVVDLRNRQHLINYWR